MMKKLLVFTLMLILHCSFAQSTYQSAGDNDPEAKVMLEKLKKEYDSYKSMEIDFTLEIDLPEQTPEVQNGKIVQNGDKFTLNTEDHEVICDGKSVWFYIKANKEVQVNDADFEESSDIMSPKDFMKIYESGDYVYAIVGEGKESGKMATFIEFKPLDKYSEYSKIRLAIDKSSNKIINLRVFSKDGSKYSFNIKRLNTNKQYPSSTFAFDKSKYPGVYIEDLRIE
jgi:outer membrane lipoprotein-sorting protein